MSSSKVQSYTVVSEQARKDRYLDRRLRRQAQKIDAAAEAWRTQDEPMITTTTMKIDFNGTIIEVERSLGFHLLHTHEARLCLDQDQPAEYIAEGAE